MFYATSDLHGYPLDDFLRLLERAGFGDDDFLFVLGDGIDRNGDGGVAMLRWMALRPNVKLILGNHESMLLDCAFLFEGTGPASAGELTGAQRQALGLWLCNGARPTLDALSQLGRRDPGALDELLGFLRRAPLYQTLSAGGRNFLLVHSGLENFAADRPLPDYAPSELLWCRPHPEDRYFEDALTVLGHTPTRFYGCPDRALFTPTWIDIDTGAAGGYPPMLLRLDDLREFYRD